MELFCFLPDIFRFLLSDSTALLIFNCFPDGCFVMLNLLPERATVCVAFGIVEEGVQVAQFLLVDATHHLNVAVFQFRIAQVGNTVV